MGKDKEAQQNLVRAELTVTVLQILNNFKSNEEPKYKVTEKDKMFVLSKIITRKLEH